MNKARVAINGFGRIGRLALRANFEKILAKNDLIEIVAINDLTPVEDAAHLLEWDSIYGKFPATITADEQHIIINNTKIPYFSERDPEALPWQKLKVDIVLECTGVFLTKETAGKHNTAGAKTVIISAPGKDEMATFCMGVNQELYTPETDTIISNASCTTNCIAPLAKALEEAYGITRATMTTIHSYTNSQGIVDGHNKKDPRRGRAAALSFFPTNTGAAKALKLVYPQAGNKFHGMAIRVPSPTVSLVDLVVELKQQVTAEEVNQMLQDRANSDMQGILDVCNKPLVSIDYRGNPHSTVIDSEYTTVLEGNLVKILAWYDNEWGYSNRIIDLAEHVHNKNSKNN